MSDRFLLADKSRHLYTGPSDIDGGFNEGHWCFFTPVNSLKAPEDVCKAAFGANKKIPPKISSSYVLKMKYPTF